MALKILQCKVFHHHENTAVEGFHHHKDTAVEGFSPPCGYYSVRFFITMLILQWKVFHHLEDTDTTV